MNPAAAETKGRVLLVDDDPVVVRLVQAFLHRHGYQVAARNEAEAGMACAAEFAPDVILLDIEMPGLDGIECCRRLQRQENLSRIPVMFFSARAKEQFIAQGFSAGAHDYLQKPFTEAELVARVANLTRMARYEQSLRDAAHELREKNELLFQELNAARRVQWALLPASLAPHPAVRSAVFYEPVAAVGGDLYDLELGKDGALRFVVADVSGHGVMAALLASFFKMGYQVYSSRESGPGEVLQSINRELCRALNPDHFITALTGWIDPGSGALRYASGGHVPGLLLRTRTAQVERLNPTGGLLGIDEDSRYEEAEAQLAPGDGLFLLTDGIIETESPAQEPFGLQRVETLLGRSTRAGPDEILQALRIELDAFQDTTAVEDDLTTLALFWNPG